MAFGHFLFGHSQFQGHGSWLVCEVALSSITHHGCPWMQSTYVVLLSSMIDVDESNSVSFLDQ